MTNQTKIKSIKIENVRGIASEKYVFDTPEMIGNKFHLLVAPNGFGKSSFAGAFSSLRPRSLRLPDSLLHNGDESNKPKIEITYSINSGADTSVAADDGKNEIAKVFSVSVINSRLKPHAVAKTGFSPYMKPTASLVVEPVVIVEKIPKKPARVFSTAEFKGDFGDSGKILPSIQQFMDNAALLRGILDTPGIGRFAQKKVWKLIDPVVVEVAAQKGTADQILAWIEANRIEAFRSVPELVGISSLLPNDAGLTEIKKFLVAYQFAKAYASDDGLLREICEWRFYLGAKKRCEDLLRSFNSNPAWIGVSVKEKGGKLVAEFPSASRMSNGQRDLLSFAAQLMRAEFELGGNLAILIVDEVFDYLDECNLLAAQFYVSRFIDGFKESGAEIFPIFLTHLDPEIFRHSVLGLGRKELRKVHLLDKASDSSRKQGIAAMVKAREDVDLKPYIGKHFFHYHPSDIDQSVLFKAKGLKDSWGRSHAFYSYVLDEFRKYCAGSETADFVAACVAARIFIEKHGYDQLGAVDKAKFTDEFNKCTADKLDFVELMGGSVPEAHRLLGLLYNDILHHKEQFDYISAIVSKMKNPAIRGMMSEIPVPISF